MTTIADLRRAQAGLRHAYRSSSVGQRYAGAVWLASTGVVGSLQYRREFHPTPVS